MPTNEMNARMLSLIGSGTNSGHLWVTQTARAQERGGETRRYRRQASSRSRLGTFPIVTPLSTDIPFVFCADFRLLPATVLDVCEAWTAA
jgi:hypothetical protein